MDSSSFYSLLLKKLSYGSAADIVRAAAEFTGQHIVLLDPSYKVLASWPHELIGDPYWDAQQQYGYVPEENLHKIFENRCPDATFNGPTYITWSEVVCPRSASSIIHDGKLLGHISIYHTDKSVPEEDIQEFCSCLENVFRVFLLNNSLVTTASTTVMSALVSKVFTGQHISQAFRDEWKAISGDELKGGFLVATVSEQTLHKSILDLISTRLGNIHRYFAFAEIEKFGYILFYGIPSQNYLHSMLARLGDYLHGYRLHCGVSDMFNDIGDVQYHMYQGRKALKLGGQLVGSELLHAYGSLRTDIMLSYICENMESKNYMHPLFRYLREEDKLNGTQYYQTLSVYLDCMCDSAKAARSLFIHRNTLLYRINHIEEAYNCSMDDEKFLKDILLSHLACSFGERLGVCENSQVQTP
ncbi:MAG: helix-turn-helix domain-containing protein [Oscillospiraceae bacterium]|nr:helix-turn-helix domain-containing protein [Oscillospiraceae bacterium]